MALPQLSRSLERNAEHRAVQFSEAASRCQTHSLQFTLLFRVAALRSPPSQVLERDRKLAVLREMEADPPPRQPTCSQWPRPLPTSGSFLAVGFAWQVVGMTTTAVSKYQQLLKVLPCQQRVGARCG